MSIHPQPWYQIFSHVEVTDQKDLWSEKIQDRCPDCIAKLF